MKDKTTTAPYSQPSTNVYDDRNIPKVDLPGKDSANTDHIVDPLPESFRPRKDGPGGD